MTWEEMKNSLEFALRMVKEATGRAENDEDKEYLLGFLNGIEFIAFMTYPDQYSEFTFSRFDLNEPIS